MNGKRKTKAFDRFGGDDSANHYAETLVKDLAKGSQTTALTNSQAIAAVERLQTLYQNTGKRFSLIAAVSEFADCKLNGHGMLEAVEGYLRNAASVKRMDLHEAVREFISTSVPRGPFEFVSANSASGR